MIAPGNHDNFGFAARSTTGVAIRSLFCQFYKLFKEKNGRLNRYFSFIITQLRRIARIGKRQSADYGLTVVLPLFSARNPGQEGL